MQFKEFDQLCRVHYAIWSRLKFVPVHLFLWGVVWLFYIYFFSYGANDPNFVFWFSASILPITIITTYLVSYLLIPRYLFKKAYFLFSLYLGYTIICSLFLILILTFINYIFLSDFNITRMPLLTRNFNFTLILVYVVVGIVCFVRLLIFNHQTSNKNKELENKLLEGQLLLKQKELHYLKQQIQPHFLFKTIHRI